MRRSVPGEQTKAAAYPSKPIESTACANPVRRTPKAARIPAASVNNWKPSNQSYRHGRHIRCRKASSHGDAEPIITTSISMTDQQFLRVFIQAPFTSRSTMLRFH